MGSSRREAAPPRKWKRVGIVLVIAAVVVMAAVSVLFFRRGASETRTQSSLGEFELLEVTAAGEVFREGSWFQHTFEEMIPRAGVRIGDMKIRGPEEHKGWGNAPLTAWVRYRGTKIQAGATPVLIGSRVVAVDSAGKEFENGPAYVRRGGTNSPGEMLISIPITWFPKGEEFLLRFSPRPDRGREREWVEFEIKNPGLQSAWGLDSLPQTNQVDGEEVVLREVTVKPAALAFEMPLSFSVVRCVIEDPHGNQFTPSRTQTRSKLGGFRYYRPSFRQALAATQSWRIELTLRHWNFAPEDYRVVQLSADSAPRSITNEAGEVFRCAFDGWALSVTGPAEKGRSGPGWKVTGATNLATGEPLEISGFASGRRIVGKPELRNWEPIERPCSNIVVRLVYPEELKAEFFLKAGGEG